MSRRLEPERQPRRAGQPAPPAPDPLRLCVFTTVAALTWLIGPVIVAGFAALGFVGYLRATRAGLRSSRCVLRDTRLVLGYLAIVGLVASAAVAAQLGRLFA